MLTGTVQSLRDDVCGFLGPDEGRGVLVPVCEVVVDVVNEGLNGVERAAANGLASEDAEPRFDHVQPGGTLRSEMEVDTGVFLQPLENSGDCVSA